MNKNQNYIGLKPKSMPQKTFNIIGITAFASMLFIGLFFVPYMLFEGFMKPLSFLVSLLLSVAIFFIGIQIYVKIHGLDPESANKKTSDKSFIIALLTAYFVIPLATVLIIESLSGNFAVFMKNTAFLLLVMLSIVSVHVVFTLLSYVRLTLLIRGYQKRKAALTADISEYAKSNLSDRNITFTNRGIVFERLVFRKKRAFVYGDYDCSYRKSRIAMFLLPSVIWGRYRKHDFENCAYYMTCSGFPRLELDLVQKGPYEWLVARTVDYIEFCILVKKGVISDDLERQIAYYHAQNEKKLDILEYLSKKYCDKKFDVLEIAKYDNLHRGVSESKYPYDKYPYDDLSGDIYAFCLREKGTSFHVHYVSGMFYDNYKQRIY